MTKNKRLTYGLYASIVKLDSMTSEFGIGVNPNFKANVCKKFHMSENDYIKMLRSEEIHSERRLKEYLKQAITELFKIKEKSSNATSIKNTFKQYIIGVTGITSEDFDLIMA